MGISSHRLPSDLKGTLEKAAQMAINDPELESRMQQANYTMRPPLSPKETKKVVLGVYETYRKNKSIIAEFK